VRGIKGQFGQLGEGLEDGGRVRHAQSLPVGGKSLYFIVTRKRSLANKKALKEAELTEAREQAVGGNRESLSLMRVGKRRYDLILGKTIPYLSM